MLPFFDSCYCIRHSPLIGIGPNQSQIAMAQQQQQQMQANQTLFSPSVEEQQQLLEDISFQIDNVTFSHHLASFNGNLMQNAESFPHPKLMQAIELLGTRAAPALRKELGGDK
jgi:hypothetical protein